MAYVDDITLLGKVRDAIEAIVVRGVQTYEIDTGAARRRFTFLDISELRAMEKDLERRIDRAATGGARVGVVRRSRP